MLDCHPESAPPVDEINQLPCSAVLPAAWEDGIELRGTAPSFPGCKRRFPRVRCRGERIRVAVELRQTLPGLPRPRAWVAVYLTDIGRGGVGLLHGEPLYPKELLQILLANGTVRTIEIIRCSRHDKHCFSIGARFVAPGERTRISHEPQGT
jgi:hypothetical protein